MLKVTHSLILINDDVRKCMRRLPSRGINPTKIAKKHAC